ncbi:MAG TPA: class D sortase [Verrucomicrobiae bacterium]|nr:class D sortase [Verrucomicrobiae bacterium]
MKNFFTRRKTMGCLLITLGIIALGLAFYWHYQGASTNAAKIAEFEALTTETAAPSSEPGFVAAPTQEEPQPSTDNIPSESKNIILGGKTIAIMTIPKIDLKVAVGEGTDEVTLNYSVGHFKGTAMPGTVGNFSVAGHRNHLYNEFFRRVDELKQGDEILVTTLQGEFKYRVNTLTTVPPEEISVLNPTKNATITLVTCTPKQNPTHRLIVKGELVTQ